MKKKLNSKKVLLLLIDSFGIGSTEDAHIFGDQGADTLGHISDFCMQNNRPLNVPFLRSKGLFNAHGMSKSRYPENIFIETDKVRNSKYGYCVETSSGKDTISGHWEMMGLPVKFDWHYFLKREGSNSVFPSDFLAEWVQYCNLEGILDIGHISGTEALKSFGKKHCMTRKPIIYTSADSVFQIAAHEKYFGLKKLFDICDIARNIFDKKGYYVGRVIARPFDGENTESYFRTPNRRDFALPPIGKTLLDNLKENNINVISIGKIADIFSDRGITKKLKANGLEQLFDVTINEYRKASDDTLIFTNFVDFDSVFGHRRDVLGYANALEYLDYRLSELEKIIDNNTIVIATADHGCDPTWSGFDHTRENIPFLLWGKEIISENIGKRSTFADIGQSIANYMDINPINVGKSVF